MNFGHSRRAEPKQRKPTENNLSIFLSLILFFLPGTQVQNDLITDYNYDCTELKHDNEGTFKEKRFKPV